MSKYFFIYFVFFQWEPNTGEKLIVTLPYMEKCEIDGMISSYEELNSAKLENFTQIEPQEEWKEPSVPTVVYIGYSEEWIYLGFKCFEKEINSIRASYAKRDEFPPIPNDRVSVYIDTYNHLKNAYVFAVNPSGVQYDGIYTPERDVDFSWDTQFESKTAIYDSFWVAEVKIYFSSLKFPSVKEQKWRIHLRRLRPRNEFEVFSWAPIDRNNPSFLGQGGIIIIPHKIKSAKRINFLPYFVLSQNGYRKNLKYLTDRIKFSNMGITIKWNIFSDLICDFTINPDYAQIETDAPQIDVNNPYALYYLEKRPFFMEGKELLETPLNLIYTRSILSPIYAFKITGKFSEKEILFLSAADKYTSYIIPSEDKSWVVFMNNLSFLNILKIKKEIINKESYIGLLLAHREVSDTTKRFQSFNRLFGFELKSRFYTHYYINYEFGYSNVKEPRESIVCEEFNGENLNGFSHFFNAKIGFKYFNSFLKYVNISPTFRSDFGYITKNNFRSITKGAGFNLYPNKLGITSTYLIFIFSREENFRKIEKRRSLGPRIEFHFKGQNIFFIEYYSIPRYLYRGKNFDNLFEFSVVNINSYFKKISWKLRNIFRRTINYSTLTPAYSYSFIFSSSINLIKNLQVEWSVERYYLYEKPWKFMIYDETSIVNKIIYQFMPSLRIRNIFQFYTGTKNLGIFPLFSYEPNPFTVFYIGANVNTMKLDKPFGIKGHNHQIFLKFQYLFKI